MNKKIIENQDLIAYWHYIPTKMEFLNPKYFVYLNNDTNKYQIGIRQKNNNVIDKIIYDKMGDCKTIEYKGNYEIDNDLYAVYLAYTDIVTINDASLQQGHFAEKTLLRMASHHLEELDWKILQNLL